MVKVFKVQGQSMYPALNDGDFVVTMSYLPSIIKVDRLLVVRHPRYKVIVKRVIAIDDTGRFLLAGDNRASIDSHQIGWLTKSDILGIVLFSIKVTRPSPHGVEI